MQPSDGENLSLKLKDVTIPKGTFNESERC